MGGGGNGRRGRRSRGSTRTSNLSPSLSRSRNIEDVNVAVHQAILLGAVLSFHSRKIIILIKKIILT